MIGPPVTDGGCDRDEIRFGMKGVTQMRNTNKALIAGAGLISALAGASSGLPQVTVVGGFNYQSWNAGTNVVDVVWRPEAFGKSWADGLRWDWQELDAGGAVVPPVPVRVYDPAVPGITAAYQFPAARAATIKPDGTGNRGPNWESQAPAGRSATLEVWFKAADLTGTHVVWEVGAGNKGAAFALDDGELVTAVSANDGAGGNAFAYEHRQPIASGEWVQAVIVINFAAFRIETWVNGVLVDSESVPPSATYRWGSGNPAGLGTLGSDPLFPDATIAADVIPASEFTDFDGMIAVHRFYGVDLMADEIEANYAALTDGAAVTRRGDFNQDGVVSAADQLDMVTWFAQTTTAPTGPVSFPFPSNPAGGIQTNDPALDETIEGDFYANRDLGFNPTGGQEPSYLFAALNTLEPVNIHDPAFPSIRTAWVMNGLEGLSGPKLEQADDTTAVRVNFWMHFDDVTGDHCLYEVGGNAVGFSLFSFGDTLAASINTSANDGLDIANISSAPGVLTPGWHHIDIVVRRFAGGGIGQGYEVYLDGAQVAAINDLPGDDGVFGTADDVNLFSPAGGGSSNFIGGNQSGFGTITGTAPLPPGVLATDLTPFNGMVGPIRVIQNQPLPDVIAAEYAAERAQVVIDARNDTDADRAATFFDVILNLAPIDAGL